MPEITVDKVRTLKDTHEEKSPEEKLIWTLVTESINHCLQFHETGRIKGFPKVLVLEEYGASLRFLEMVDEGMLVLGGFQKVSAIFQGIQIILARAAKVKISVEPTLVGTACTV